ncbi:MAG TPA: protein kinase family protein [Acidothermaceae bacterium]
MAPGLLIAERYRLESPLSAETTSQRVGRLWRAYDEVLARPVAILLVEGDDPGVPEVLAGARAAARLTHAAVVRVYDAGEAPGLAFVVTEFLSGGSLEAQLLVGPLDPSNAVDLVSDLAVGVAAAHDVGLHGLSLTPSSVLFTATGAPRLVGIALADHNMRDATVNGPDGHPLAPHADKVEQARLDAIGLARLLYAALTAKWPGPPPESALPPAPYAEGHLRTPRQVRGGVAREIDAVVAEAIGDESLLRGLAPITSPAEFAAALAPLRTSSDDAHPYGADTQPITELDLRQVRRSAGRIAGEGRWRRIAIVIGVALLGVVIAGLAFSGSSGYLRFVTGAPEPGPTATPTPTPTTTTAAVNTTTTGLVTEFDPYGNHKDPHVAEAPRAVDGNPATAWRTQIYRTADLGKLKPGVGLLVDFGSPRKVSAVHLVLVGNGTSVELFESTGDTAPTSEKAMTSVASQANAPADVTLRPDDATSARFWMIWLTTLPATAAGFQGGIAEMTFLP